MRRKTFLNKMIGTTLAISVSNLVVQCSSSKDQIQREILETPILHFLFYAIKSPNAHNTQPWKVKLLSESEILLFVDENRMLSETDPTTRQIHISQGTFLESFQIAATNNQMKSNIQLFPEGNYNLSQVGKKPVAKIKLEKVNTLQKDVLFDNLEKRITNRTIYSGSELTQNEKEEIKKITNPKYSELIFFSNDLLPEIKKLLLEAYILETKTYKKHDESKNWFRFNDSEIYSKRDGISLRGNGLEGFFYTLVSNFILSKENWHSKSNQDSGIEIFAKALNSSSTIACLKTNQNDFKNWIQVGRDYVRLNLALTKLGFQLHPMSQILQEYSEMTDLSNKLNDLLGTKQNEKIQMLVRIGKSDYFFQSPRREIKSILI